MYTLSVIIPVYNTIQYLDQCVISVINQSLEGIEIILIDDESPDGAGKRCDQLALDYNNIKVVHKKNGGLGFARNSGLEIATGKYVAFLDSDDYVESDYYEKMTKECEKHDASLCAAKGFYAFAEGSHKEQFVFVHNYEIIEQSDIQRTIPRLISRNIGTDDGIWGSSCFSVYNREMLEKNKIRFVSEHDFLSEDTWFSMDVYNASEKVVLADIIGYCYRYNENSLSRSYRANRFEQLICTIDQLETKCKEMNLSNVDERIALYFWVNFEKCINQEVRYVNKKKGIQSIKRMMMNPVCRNNLQILLDCKGFKGLHRLLCSLLMYGHYNSVYSVLTVYNHIKHK